MSRVIRGAGAAPRVVPAELADARAEADRVIADARGAAASIVEEARAEAAGILEAAGADAERVRRDARDEGLAAAHALAARTLVEAQRARDAAIAGAEHDVQTLALAAAAQIVGDAIAAEPTRIVAIVRGALARARRARSIEVRVHPDDAAALAGAALDATVRLVVDPEIARGGCVVRSELGVIDARVQVRIEAMARILGCEAP